GRRRRAGLFRAVLPCLSLIALGKTAAQAQSLTPDLFNPTRGAFVAPQDLLLRPAAANLVDNPGDIDDPNAPAPSRIGQVPVYGLPAANGAADSGYDSLNRQRKP